MADCYEGVENVTLKDATSEKALLGSGEEEEQEGGLKVSIWIYIMWRDTTKPVLITYSEVFTATHE